MIIAINQMNPLITLNNHGLIAPNLIWIYLFKRPLSHFVYQINPLIASNLFKINPFKCPLQSLTKVGLFPASAASRAVWVVWRVLLVILLINGRTRLEDSTPSHVVNAIIERSWHNLWL